MYRRPPAMPLLPIVPPVVDHCSDPCANATAALSVFELSTAIVRGADWDGTSETRAGATSMPKIRPASGPFVASLQPITSAPASSIGSLIRESRCDSLNLKFIDPSLRNKKPPARAGGPASKAVTRRSPVALRHRLSPVLL